MYHGRTHACMHCVPLFLPGNKDVAGKKKAVYDFYHQKITSKNPIYDFQSSTLYCACCCPVRRS